MHVRGQIRERLGVLLGSIDGLLDHVTFDLPGTVDETVLPWAYVWLGNETIQPITTGGKQARQVELFIDLLARDRSEITGRVEDIAARIELALAADKSLGGLVTDQVLNGYTLDRSDTSAGQASILRVRMEYGLTYLTNAGNASVAV